MKFEICDNARSSDVDGCSSIFSGSCARCALITPTLRCSESRGVQLKANQTAPLRNKTEHNFEMLEHNQSKVPSSRGTTVLDSHFTKDLHCRLGEPQSSSRRISTLFFCHFHLRRASNRRFCPSLPSTAKIKTHWAWKWRAVSEPRNAGPPSAKPRRRSEYKVLACQTPNTGPSELDNGLKIENACLQEPRFFSLNIGVSPMIGYTIVGYIAVEFFVFIVGSFIVAGFRWTKEYYANPWGCMSGA